MAMSQEDYEKLVADTRARPDWKPDGDPMCSDCCTMSHCETHFKLDGHYPEWVTRGGSPRQGDPK
jgi:hypothetical protein